MFDRKKQGIKKSILKPLREQRQNPIRVINYSGVFLSKKEKGLKPLIPGSTGAGGSSSRCTQLQGLRTQVGCRSDIIKAGIDANLHLHLECTYF